MLSKKLPSSLTVLQATAMSRKDAPVKQEQLDLLLEALEALDLVEEIAECITPYEMVDEVLAPFEGLRKRLQAALDGTPSDHPTLPAPGSGRP